MKKTVAALAISLMASGAAVAGDAAAGQAAFGSCVGCHGMSAEGGVGPQLAGKDAAFITEQLKAFKDGSRPSAMMAGIAAGLSDDDMANIAAYVSGL